MSGHTHIEGTAETLVAADLLPIDEGADAGTQTNPSQSEQARGTLSKSLDTAADRPGAPECSMDLMGNAAGDPAVVPPYDRLLRASGYRRYRCRRLILTSWTGGNVIPHLTMATLGIAAGGGSAATKRVVGIHRQGDSTHVFIDLDSGGSYAGYVAAQQQLLALVDEDTRIVPGHGEITNRAGLAEDLRVLQDAHARVAALVAEGLSADEVVARNPLAQYHDEYNWAFITTERMTRTLHRDITAAGME